MKVLLPIILLLLLSCDQDPQYEEYEIPNQVELSLTQINHPHGWQQEECFSCHVKASIHNDDTLNTGIIEEARRSVDTYGISGCYQCHGYNGVTP